MPDQTVPCETCGEPTRMTGTRRCDHCWEVEHRLRMYLRHGRGARFVAQELARVMFPDDAKFAQLLALADGAVQGPWRIGSGFGSVVAPVENGGRHADPENVRAYGGSLIGESIERRNALFVAAADPDTVRSLVLEVQRLRKEIAP